MTLDEVRDAIGRVKVEELAALEKAATPGPWEYETNRHHAQNQGVHSVEVVQTDNPAYPVATVMITAWKPDGRRDARPNARLIAALRNAAPQLLALVWEMAEWVEVVEAARDIADCGFTDIDERLKYIEVQVSRREWERLRAALGRVK